ncbi:ATP-binding protein [Paracoccus sp. MBLB3053]|uniref:ATP-binding protein n=1 Tax=Paracoccus aurantius TaxID=3073814 RepID=A0ABU2HP79_9RHOB|nr:ATP-binding protein [Paracoccus sp. MBLB3053]MDS9466365.1 ATP-binding protein [Paracoccus sp. MBLB3053]
MLHRIFRADALTVRQALVFMRARFIDCAEDEVIARLELALAEVLNNICQHGACARSRESSDSGPVIHLCVVRHVGGIACAVTDDGRPLPPDCLGERVLPLPADDLDISSEEALHLLPEGGFGWYLIQDLATSLTYFREGDRNFLAFIIPIEAGADRNAEGKVG